MIISHLCSSSCDHLFRRFYPIVDNRVSVFLQLVYRELRLDLGVFDNEDSQVGFERRKCLVFGCFHGEGECSKVGYYWMAANRDPFADNVR